MRLALIIVGILVGIVLIIVGIGSLLPREHVAALSARIAAPPAAVWAAITQPERFTTWRGDLTRVEMLTSTGTGPSWREHSRNGTLTMAIESAEPPRRVVTRILDAGLPYGGQWEYEIVPDGADASRVTITERGWVSNPIFRFASRFVIGHTATLDTYLRALGKHFGSEPTPSVATSTGG